MIFWHILPFTQLGPADIDRPVQGYEMIGSTAVVQLVGPTSKYGGWSSTSTVKLREQIRQAAGDPAVESVMLHVDSPGGQVAGNVDLAMDVRQLSETKPTFTYASDMLASAAYETASQTGRIYANESALVGSIGTMSSLTDYSKMAADAGVKVHPVTSGGMKGAGMPGTPITQDQINYYQNLINQMNDQFVGLVASGRNMDVNQARGLADGRVHLAADASKLGLIDGVATLETAVGNLQDFTNFHRGTYACIPTPVMAQ